MTGAPVRVAVIGAGAAGTLTAAHLLHRAASLGAGLEVSLIDPAATTGRGLAYATASPHHLLNVPAARMSAYPGLPGDFTAWLDRRAPGVHTGADHVPRALYGAYLADVLADAASAPGPARLYRVHERVVDVRPTGGGLTLTLSSGTPLRADAAVLAPGNFPPGQAWVPAALRRSPRYLPDPWAPGALDAPPGEGPVLLVGTGLTMVDVALTLTRAGRTVQAVSRHGLLPQPHTGSPLPTAPPLTPDPGAGLHQLRRALLRHVSACRRSHGDWRVGIDSLRPVTAELWQQLPLTDRIRFLRHHQTLWNVHRHRIPPATARALRRETAAGRIAVTQGEIADAQETAGSLTLHLRDGRTLRAGTVINCTGPEEDVRRLDDPLITALLTSRLATPDPTGLGFRVTPTGRLYPAPGHPPSPLWTLGSLRRGALLESTAIPELRTQSHTLATTLLGAPSAAKPVLGRAALRAGA
ncbi:FAD/NAD(P)-binding protein [Streptomyces sp. NPDC001546]|uniref:FAD/NAD(P)-binding protein n=1 Tax=Streptomyces sp. NPDC001546 TaxID=3364585 RepID=UPI00368CF3C6